MDGSGLRAIKTERVADTVYRMLRERIVTGAFAPGSKLNVDDIAKRLQVSRTPVHEALTVLANDGLVEIQPRRGTFVAEFTAEDYAETLDVRRALEWLACETACHHATDDDIEELERLAADMALAVKEIGDPEAAARTHDSKNLAFHLSLVELSGNRRLIDMYDDLRAHLRIARAHLNATAWLERVPVETAEHQRILDALRARDPSAMQRALNDHLCRSSRSLVGDVMRTEGGAQQEHEVREPLEPTTTQPPTTEGASA